MPGVGMPQLKSYGNERYELKRHIQEMSLKYLPRHSFHFTQKKNVGCILGSYLLPPPPLPFFAKVKLAYKRVHKSIAQGWV